MEANNTITIFIVQRNAVESKFDLPSLSQTECNIRVKGMFGLEITGPALTEIMCMYMHTNKVL